MPRTKKQNEIIREAAKENILDAALELYVSYGYAGTVMDKVAEQADIAKGLLYYYYKSKKALFIDLFNRTMMRISRQSVELFKRTEGKPPVERLVGYSTGIFKMGIGNPLDIQFAMRMPFDAYAVFGPEGWQKGMEGSAIHTTNLERIIQDGIDDGLMKCPDAASCANAFWTVYVAGLYKYTKMMDGSGNDDKPSEKDMENLLAFGMAGLGIDEGEWKTAVSDIVGKMRH